MIHREFTLASGSPRRRQLLVEAGFRFKVVPSEVDEPQPQGFQNPEAYVTHLAWFKAMDVARRESGLVLAADTACAVDNHVLGKPIDRSDAVRILRLLQGTSHITLTGVCLVLPAWLPPQPPVLAGASRLAIVGCDTTVVHMRELNQKQLEEYLDSGLWKDKAGAYGIQEREDPFVERIEGSYTNVVGLPMELLERLFGMLEPFGL